MNAATPKPTRYDSAELTQAFSRFFDNWSCSSLKLHFLSLFSYAAKGGMENNKVFPENIALLFDQLIDLVAAAEALHQVSGAPDRDQIDLSGTKRKGDVHE